MIDLHGIINCSIIRTRRSLLSATTLLEITASPTVVGYDGHSWDPMRPCTESSELL